MRRSRPAKRAMVLLAVLIALAGTVIFLEWLGSEKQQKWVEVPVTPAAEKGSKD